MRLLQKRCGCSDKTCDDVVRTFSKYLGGVGFNFRAYDQKMQQVAGAKMLRLNGCPCCKKHVYVPWSKRKSRPRCGTARFDTDGKPKELVYYFPVRSKLKALLKTPSYKRMVQHEFFRPRNEEVMSDVYDAPAWRDFMGAVVYPNNRIGLLFALTASPLLLQTRFR